MRDRPNGPGGMPEAISDLCRFFRVCYWGTFFQSSRNLSMPLSVRGCFHNDGNREPGIVAMSAPRTAACCTC